MKNMMGNPNMMQFNMMMQQAMGGGMDQGGFGGGRGRGRGGFNNNDKYGGGKYGSNMNMPMGNMNMPMGNMNMNMANMGMGMGMPQMNMANMPMNMNMNNMNQQGGAQSFNQGGQQSFGQNKGAQQNPKPVGNFGNQNPQFNAMGGQAPMNPNMSMGQQASEWPLDKIQANVAGFDSQSDDIKKNSLGKLMFTKVQQLSPDCAKSDHLTGQVTAMMIDPESFSTQEVLELLADDDSLLTNIQEGIQLAQGGN